VETGAGDFRRHLSSRISVGGDAYRWVLIVENPMVELVNPHPETEHSSRWKWFLIRLGAKQ
jgi:hypothetical protein